MFGPERPQDGTKLRDLALDLHGAEGRTLTQRIAWTIEEAIRAGRLKPGDALPGSRILAGELNVNRNTVIAALESLEAEGWLVSEHGRGTFVAGSLPMKESAPGGEGPISPGLGFDLPSRLSPISTSVPGALNLSEGLADSRLAPTDEMGKAYQRALRRHGQELLQYGEPQGNQLLRETFSQWISERHGIPVPPEQVLVTRGSRMALTLVCVSLLNSGDSVGVENPGNPSAWDTFKRATPVELCPLGMDPEGVCLSELEAAQRSGPLKLLYLTPRRQMPTGIAMSTDRAEAILAWAAQHRVAILEDDVDAEIRFQSPRPLPLLARDRTGQVIFTASLSRILAPGVRVGFLVVPPTLVAPLARMRRDLEWQGDRVLEWAVADLMRDGEVTRHLRRVRKVYGERLELMASLLRQHLGQALSFDFPDGGMSLWLKVAPDIDVAAWVRKARELGLVLHPPTHYFMGAPDPHLRIGFAQANEQEIEEAVRRLREALDQIRIRT